MTDEQIKLLDDIIDSAVILRSNQRPSQWYESRMVMPQGSRFPGPVHYDRNPHLREIVDCAAPDHPAIDISVMGPAQDGKSFMVINPIIGYTIDVYPGNILLLTGHSDLTKKAMVKVDQMIEYTGIRHHIRPTIIKARNNRSGDTTFDKEFRGCNFWAGSITNHNMLRQLDVMILLADDLDAAKRSKEETGSTRELAKGRTAAYEGKFKRYWISTPQIKGMSNIEDSINLSDRRNWNVLCPKCGSRIVLKLPHKVDDKNMAGLFWKTDEFGRVIQKSVGYICQKKGCFFTDQKKYDLLNSGIWVPTQEPKELNHYGFEFNGLISAPGMSSWFSRAVGYVNCHPPGQPRKEKEAQTFYNIQMGMLYEPPGTSIKSSELAKNVRKYEIGSIPEKLSIKDGNGKIVLLTATADLGGRMAGINGDFDDVRLDWEIKAWTETGSSYSIDQGSIGNFRPAHMGADDGHERWTYDISKPRNVWTKFREIITKPYFKDSDGSPMYVGITGIDTGFAEHHAFTFIDQCAHNVIGLKGDKDHKYTMFGDSTSNWKPSAGRNKLYMLKVNKLKDQLAAVVNLRWDRNSNDPQPPGYMNFPEPRDGKYSLEHFFMHYGAEHRVVDVETGDFIWKKTSITAQNHFFDVGNYHFAVKEIFTDLVLDELKIKNGTWVDYCKFVLKAA